MLSRFSNSPVTYAHRVSTSIAEICYQFHNKTNRTMVHLPEVVEPCVCILATFKHIFDFIEGSGSKLIIFCRTVAVARQHKSHTSILVVGVY